MDWTQLKEGKCPSKCGGKIKPRGLIGDGFYYCEFCHFKISEKRYDEIISSKRVKIIREDNLSALNNLGHKKMSEDYSDEIERI